MLRAARRAGIHEPECVVAIPTAWAVVRTMPERVVVSNRSDKHSAFREALQEYIRCLDDGLLSNAGLVVYVSRALTKSKAAPIGDRAFLLDHGVPRTLYQGIRQLPQAHRLCLTHMGHLDIVRHWSIPEHLDLERVSAA